MAFVRIPRPTPLPEPDLENGNYRVDANWKQKSPIPAWWFANRSIRGVFQDAPALFGHRSMQDPGTWRDFLLSMVNLSDSFAYSAEVLDWRPIRILGEGGFGLCGLWQLYDIAGNVTGELALKQERRAAQLNADAPDYEVRGHRGLLMEALLQRDLNRLPRSININHLYDFKYNTSQNLFRMYMINNPHQSLRVLRDKYSMFDEYLPELFLWTLLISLLEGILLMEADPTHRTMAEAIPEGARVNARPYMLHLDLKPGNILLDYPLPPEEQQHLWDQYPVVRIADFGMARYTHAHDARNPDPDLKWRCTNYYKPPESLEWKAYRKFVDKGRTIHPMQEPQWQPDPQGIYGVDYEFEHPPNATTQKFSSSHNLWCVGKTVFDLVTMHELNTCAGIMDQIDEQHYDELGQHFLELQDPVAHTLNNEPDLMAAFLAFNVDITLENLIRDCLTPTANLRPTTQNVLDRARTGRDEYVRRLRAATGDNAEALAEKTKLHFRGNEINQMARGNANFPHTRTEHYRTVLEFDDPDWEPFTPPEERWGRHRPRSSRRTDAVIEKDGVLFYGANSAAALREAEAHDVRKEAKKLLKTRDQWMADDLFEIVAAVRKKEGWTEDEAHRNLAVMTKAQLVDMLMGAEPPANAGNEHDEAPLRAARGTPRKRKGKRASGGVRSGRVSKRPTAKRTQQRNTPPRASGARASRSNNTNEGQQIPLRRSKRIQGEDAD